MISSRLLLALGFLSSPAFAETSVAKCKGLQFHFNRTTNKAQVYLKTSGGIFQITQGPIKFDNQIALRAPMDGIEEGVKGFMSEIGLNRSRNIVYVLYRNPLTGQVKDGIFCNTPIIVEP